jgi:hypothetical protein
VEVTLPERRAAMLPRLRGLEGGTNQSVCSVVSATLESLPGTEVNGRARKPVKETNEW